MNPIKFDHFVVFENGYALGWGSTKKIALTRSLAPPTGKRIRLNSTKAAGNQGELYIRRATKRFCKAMTEASENASPVDFMPIRAGNGGSNFATLQEFLAMNGDPSATQEIERMESEELAAKERRSLSKLIGVAPPAPKRSSRL